MSLRQTPEHRARINEVLSLLGNRYPQLFPLLGARARPPPLAVGIAKDVAAALGGEVSEGELKHAFRVWCGSPRYLKALTAPRAVRRNLEGNAVGPVHAEAVEQAGARLAAFNARKTPSTGTAEAATSAAVPVTRAGDTPNA